MTLLSLQMMDPELLWQDTWHDIIGSQLTLNQFCSQVHLAPTHLVNDEAE